jgi:hypothetical protein
LRPEYVSDGGGYSYDNLIELYNALGVYLEEKPMNDAGYPEPLGLRVKNVAKDLETSLKAGRIDQDLHDKIAHRRRFETFDIELVTE